MLLSSTVLVHYDKKKPLRLACDASPYGVGAVISHVMDNGVERPIAFASPTLTDAEKKYVQIEKEALAIIYGVNGENSTSTYVDANLLSSRITSPYWLYWDQSQRCLCWQPCACSVGA